MPTYIFNCRAYRTCSSWNRGRPREHCQVRVSIFAYNARRTCSQWLTISSPTVKRVVVLSSNAAVTRNDETGRITEENWNTRDPGLVDELGAKMPQGLKYRASKTIAERGKNSSYLITTECSDQSLSQRPGNSLRRIRDRLTSI